MDSERIGQSEAGAPELMTTTAAMLGAVPIALGYGAGGEARRPLGLVVVGGLVFSQLVTLYLTPVFYNYMAGAQEPMRSRKTHKKLTGLACYDVPCFSVGAAGLWISAKADAVAATSFINELFGIAA